MSTLRQLLKQIRVSIARADSLLLDGLSRPWGQNYDIGEDATTKRESSIAIIAAYNLLKETGKDYPKLLNHLYYLARGVYLSDHDEYIFSVCQTPSEICDQIKVIAKEGRELGNSSQISIKQRVGKLRLFVLGDYIFPAQIRDSKRGCSASICTNCYEPICYSNEKCPCCRFEVIGPFGFPEIELWQKLSNYEKRRLVENVYFSNQHGKLGILISGGKLKPMVFSRAQDFNISPE